ncbi:MAG TPA: MFS transporter [Ktedonobacterales bacterium]|nr:MFS transporter [Ktedonobacterales bacterium]
MGECKGGGVKLSSLSQNRSFLLLWSGQLVSWVGTEVTGLALPLITLALTHSAGQAGAIVAMRGFAFAVFALPAGAFVDRWDRKLVMVIANAGSGLAMGGICVALALNHLAIAFLYAASLIEGVSFAFANLARFASLPSVARNEQYPKAMAAMSVAENMAQLIGPLLGGILYQALGAVFAFLADTCSYFINAISISFVTTSLQDEQPERRATSIREEIREGIIWWWREPTIRTLNLLTSGRAAAASGSYLLVIVLAKQHHASSATVGVVMAVAAIGGIGGSLVASQLHHWLGFHRSLQVATVCCWLIVTSYATTPNIAALAIITAAFFFIIPLYDVTTATYSARHIPDHIRGRITSLARILVLSSFSLGSLVAGFTLQFLGSAWTVSIFSAMLLTVTLTAWFHPAIRGSVASAAPARTLVIPD